MSAPARTSLRSLITPALTAQDLAELTSTTAHVHSALTDWPKLGRQEGLALVAAETTAPEDIEVVEDFGDDSHEGLVIHGRIHGEPTAQILFATFDEHGRIAELKSYFKYMYPFTLIREQVRAGLPDIPADAWTVHTLAADTGDFHESPKSVPYAADLEFHSPVMRKSFTQPLLSQVLSHASSIYGVRKWSDLRLGTAERHLAWFDADISGQTIEMASLMTMEGRLAKEMNAFCRPWTAALALYSRMTDRLPGQLTGYRWDDEQPGYDSYR